MGSYISNLMCWRDLDVGLLVGPAYGPRDVLQTANQSDRASQSGRRTRPFPREADRGQRLEIPCMDRRIKCSDARKPHWASGIQRCIYDDHPPILSVTDTHVPVSVTVRDTSQVTAEDVRLRRLAPRFRMLSTGVRARPRRTGWRQAHPLKG